MPSSRNARLFYRIAKQRFEDAEFLLEFERTTAAVYMAGYSVECFLKALVLSTVVRARENDILKKFRTARAHDLGWLLQLYIQNGGTEHPPELVRDFARVNAWSTDMRYSPGSVEFREAKAFLDSVVRIIHWADGRL